MNAKPATPWTCRRRLRRLRRRPLAAAAAIALAVLAACSVRPTALRSRLESDAYGHLAVRVQLEGSDGASLDGALVRLTTPAGSVVVLGYDGGLGAFTADLDGAQSGAYRIDAAAYLGKTSLSQTIGHAVLTAKPLFTAIQDAGGADGLAGDDLDAATAIACAWSPVPGATAYLLRVTRSGAVVAAIASDLPQAVLAAGSLPAGGDFAFSVTAQAIAGDPYLTDPPFYSVGSVQGSTAYCSTR